MKIYHRKKTADTNTKFKSLPGVKTTGNSPYTSLNFFGDQCSFSFHISSENNTALNNNERITEKNKQSTNG